MKLITTLVVTVALIAINCSANISNDEYSPELDKCIDEVLPILANAPVSELIKDTTRRMNEMREAGAYFETTVLANMESDQIEQLKSDCNKYVPITRSLIRKHECLGSYVDHEQYVKRRYPEVLDAFDNALMCTYTISAPAKRVEKSKLSWKKMLKKLFKS